MITFVINFFIVYTFGIKQQPEKLEPAIEERRLRMLNSAGASTSTEGEEGIKLPFIITNEHRLTQFNVDYLITGLGALLILTCAYVFISAYQFL